MKTILILACVMAIVAAASAKDSGDLAPDQWTVSTAFDNPVAGGERKGLDVDFLKGEEAVTSLKGKKVRGRVVDFASIFSTTENKVAYALGTINCSKPAKMTALFGSDDGAKVWVNGALVHRIQASRAMVPDEDKFEVSLKKGVNTILVKVENGGGGWGFAFSLPTAEELRRRQEAAFAKSIAMSEIVPGPHGGFGRVLRDPTFPALSYKDGLLIEKFLGSPDLKTRWFDQDANEVSIAQKPGLYFAWVEGLGKSGLPFNRVIPFFLPGPEMAPFLDLDWASILFSPAAEAPDPSLKSRWDTVRKVFPAILGPSHVDSFFQSDSAAWFLAALDGMKPLSGSPQGWAAARDGMALKVKLKALGISPKRLAEPRRGSSSAPILRVGKEAEAGMKAGTAEKIKAVLAEWSRAEGKPFSAVIARKGVVFVHEGYGVDKDALFYPASIGKTLFGLVFAQFVDQGLVKPDQPIGELLSGFPTKGPKALTFRHLLTHTSGIAGHGTYGGWSNTTLDSAFLQWTPTLEPGRVFAYGGDGNNLASKALEIISGRPIAELMDRQLFAPLGAAINQPDGGWSAQATSWDIAKVGQMIANKGRYGDITFMKEETWKGFLPTRVAEHITSLTDKGLEWGYAISYMMDPDGPRSGGVLGPNVVGHGSASSSILRVDLDSGLVVVMGRYGVGNEAAYNEGKVKLMKALKEGLAD